MPWPIFNRPSIQLGTLKSYLRKNADWLRVSTKHPYLEVASALKPDLYHWISQNTWVGEALYAPILFPGQKKSAEALVQKNIRKADASVKKRFQAIEVRTILAHQLKKWIRETDWSRYKIVGFSVCFNQLLASLAAARLLKKEFPDIIIVFGGSSCAADAGKSLLDAFDFIDFIIPGEGEESLLELCRHIAGRRNNLPENILSGQSFHQQTGIVHKTSAGVQLPSLASLFTPDFDDYFNELQIWFSEEPFIPVLPVEFSRGCWWNKCSFCNLNLQWCGYRFKKARQMVDEITALSSRYGCLDFVFTDNMIPPQESLRFFSMTEKLSQDLTFFAEIRAMGKGKSINEIFERYQRGGLTTIQVGIESLSNSLLKKMNKGTSVLENIAAMRAANEHSLALEGNLIIRFPGSTRDEVDETLENLEYVFPYTPLTDAVFFLGNDSPVYADPAGYSIRAVINHANNKMIFPGSVLEKLSLIVMDYRGDRIFQKKLWQPVAARIKDWRRYHEKRKASALHLPLLSYKDGNNFLLIRQELPGGTVLHHRLKGFSRRIYLTCLQIKTEQELFEEFSTIPQQKILAFLADLTKKRLVFSEKNRYISLAVRRMAR